MHCAHGELIDDAALREAITDSGKVAGAALDAFHVEPPPPGFLSFALDPVLATPHIGGPTGRGAGDCWASASPNKWWSIYASGVAINAVNMPALSPSSTARSVLHFFGGSALGQFCRPHLDRKTQDGSLGLSGKIADSNTNPDPQCGLAGRSEPVADAQSEPGEMPCNRIPARLEHRRAA